MKLPESRSPSWSHLGTFQGVHLDSIGQLSGSEVVTWSDGWKKVSRWWEADRDPGAAELSGGSVPRGGGVVGNTFTTIYSTAR